MSLPVTSGVHKNFIRVRPYRNSDGDKPARIFKQGIVEGAKSSTAAALRGSLRGRQAILVYCTFLIGACLQLAPRPHFNLSAIVLCSVSVVFLVTHQMLLWKIMTTHGSRDHPDMRDISSHYKVSQDPNKPALTGPDGFWVAEVVEEGQTEGEVVGCVGLDTSIARSPGTAELRRMAVVSTMQRRGIGRMLIEAALAHAKAHGISTIWLSTTGHQQSAVGIYEKFGWKNMGPSILKMAPFWIDARIMDWRLDFKSEARRAENKDWEKMA